MGVTLKDIAEKVNLSTTTVSMALSPGKGEKYNISPVTIQKIRTVARDLGYRSNQLAASLRSKRTNTVGVLVARMDYFISEMLNEIKQEIYPSFTPLLTVHNSDPAAEQAELETLMRQRVDGVIAVFSGATDSIETYRQLSKIYETPVVLIDRAIPGLDLPVIRADHYRSTYDATKTLIDMGHRRIHFVCLRAAPELLEGSRLREEGYRGAMCDAGLGDNIRITPNRQPDAWTEKNLRKFAQQVLDNWQIGNGGITALLVEVDLLAYEILNECKVRGIKVPGELSIMGIGDYPFSSQEMVGLSTVARERLGRKAASVLRMLINSEKIEEKTFVLPVKVMLRKTTGVI